MKDAPEPGSPEYEQAMAEKYRRQDEPEFSLGQAAVSHVEIVSPTGLTLQIREDSTMGPPGQEEYYSEAMADPLRVMQIEEEIARLRRELSETRGFDPRTGEVLYVFSGEARHTRALQLLHLEERELPHVREMQRRAIEWRAANVPTTEDKLRTELARQQATRRRAEEIANEREARAQAEKILASRRTGGIDE